MLLQSLSHWINEGLFSHSGNCTSYRKQTLTGDCWQVPWKKHIQTWWHVHYIYNMFLKVVHIMPPDTAQSCIFRNAVIFTIHVVGREKTHGHLPERIHWIKHKRVHKQHQNIKKNILMQVCCHLIIHLWFICKHCCLWS